MSYKLLIGNTADCQNFLSEIATGCATRNTNHPILQTFKNGFNERMPSIFFANNSISASTPPYSRHNLYANSFLIVSLDVPQMKLRRF
jgi:hypothetical protein